MRKLLCGLALASAAILVLPGHASAAEEGIEIGITADEAAKEAGHAAEESGADHDVVECVENAIKNNDSDRCVESPSPILPATNEIVWGSLSFLLLLAALWKFGVPAAKSMMDARTERIRTSIDDAERAKADAEGVLVQYQAQLADARAESARIIEEARVQAEQVRRDLIAKAEADATELRQRTADQASAERDRVMGELRSQVSELAIELAEKVVESSLDREANMRLIENYISSVGSR
jgi:F-type H+-transporting ATPase subunit b